MATRAMEPTANQHTWDMLIVAPIGEASDLAHGIRASLVEHGLRVKLDVVSEQRLLPLPASCTDDAKRARFCMVLGMIGTTIHFALMPAPKCPGQVPDIAPIGTRAAPGQVEIGPLTEGLSELAARIESLLRG